MAPCESKTRLARNGTFEEMRLATSGTKLDLRKKVKRAIRNKAHMAACKGLSNWNKGNA